MVVVKLCVCIFLLNICAYTRTSKCIELNGLLQTTDREDYTLLQHYQCYMNRERNLRVCCPKTSPTVPPMNSIRNYWNEESTSRKKRHDNFPWSMHGHRNFVHNHQGQDFYNHFHGPKFGFMHHHNHFVGDDNFGNSLQKNNEDQNKWFNSVLVNNSKSVFEEKLESNNHILNWWDNKSFANDELDGENDFNLTPETSFSAFQSCLTPDNRIGICQEIRQCPSMMDVLKKVNISNRNEVDYLKKFQCPNSESQDIKVCCSNDTIVLPVEDSVSKEEVPDSASCGRQIIDDKILGGTATGLAEFPWAALLQYTSSRGRRYGCGGSVISKRYVLTAAHCVNREIIKQAGLLKLDRVILGEYDTRNDTDCFYTRYGSDCANPPQIFNIDQTTEHELFSPNNTVHDIALIRVDRDIVFSKYVMPICLPNNTYLRLLGNESFLITGWGRTETGQTSPVKRKATLPFVDKANCSQLGALGEGQMCLGSERGVDSCKGDSGGPVMHTVPVSGNVVTTIVGIVSYGFGRCGITSSVSTYVPFYLDWILTHLP